MKNKNDKWYILVNTNNVYSGLCGISFKIEIGRTYQIKDLDFVHPHISSQGFYLYDLESASPWAFVSEGVKKILEVELLTDLIENVSDTNGYKFVSYGCEKVRIIREVPVNELITVIREYDKNGNLLKRTSPNNEQVISYTYNDNNQKIHEIWYRNDLNLVECEYYYEYDEHGRLILKTYGDKQPYMKYQYNEFGNISDYIRYDEKGVMVQHATVLESDD